MERLPYRDRDYSFGQKMLTLRAATGLTQTDLASELGVSRRAVGDWEAGNKYPKAGHLKKCIEFAAQHGALPVGREGEEIRSLWRASRQKVLLDEAWLASLLRQSLNPVSPSATRARDLAAPPAPAVGRPRTDWGAAPSVSTFYGRTGDLDSLAQWAVHERCRVVGVVGLGGIGKSALAVSLMHQVAAQFDMVIWRSLRDVPSVEALLDDCLRVVAPQVFAAGADAGSSTSERRMNTLLGYMRDTRLLLVLDNLETILEEGAGTGSYPQGAMQEAYEGYSRLLHMVAETEHQSCLLFTSREKPADVVPLEGLRSPVRTLRLAPLEADACEALLAEKEVKGSGPERARLINAYAGNPLALKIVGQSIVDLFGGEPRPFLEQGGVIFGGVRDLLARQFDRLSPTEQRMMIWLAILREPASLEELQAVLITPALRTQLLEVAEALHRRSLVERSKQAGSFTLQSVVLEYVISRLITDMSCEIEQGRLELAVEYALEQAQAPDYVRQTQERLIVAPLLGQLRRAYSNRGAVEQRLLALLAQLRTLDGQGSTGNETHGYAPANLVALLRLHRGDLRGVDLSRLVLRGAYLQGVEMQDASLRWASIQDSLFTEAFDGVLDLSLAADGRYLLASTQGGSALAWETAGLTLRRVWESPGNGIIRVAISPDGGSVVCGYSLGEVKLWNIQNGTLYWSSDAYPGVASISTLALSPDGSTLAVGDTFGHVRLLDLRSGRLLQSLQHAAAVTRVAWHPAGHLLATSLRGGSILLWQLNTTYLSEPGKCMQTIDAHTRVISGLAFSPSGRHAGPSASDVADAAGDIDGRVTLASSSFDGTIKLWDPESGQLREVLNGHPNGVSCIAWSPDGRTLASGNNLTSLGADSAIWLWDLETSNPRATLRGHDVRPTALAFTPDGSTLFSGAEDGTLRVWELRVDGGKCVRVLHGYETAIATHGGVEWNRHGTQLISCSGGEGLLTLFDVDGTTRPRVLAPRNRLAINIAWSPDERCVALVSQTNSIELWDPASGERVDVIKNTLDSRNNFHAASWSPDGKWLAAITDGYGLLMWDVASGSQRWPAHPWPTSFWAIPAWHPSGKYVASGGFDGAVHIWDAVSGNIVKVLRATAAEGRSATVWSLAWSSDGARLLSCGRGGEAGELLVWDPWREEIVRRFSEHPGSPSGAVWGHDDGVVVSASTDRKLRWWSVESGECLWARESQPDNILGLSRCPDGSKLASYGPDATIMVWDLGSGEHLRTLRSDRPYERLEISGIKGLTDARKATLRSLGAIEDQS